MFSAFLALFRKRSVSISDMGMFSAFLALPRKASGSISDFPFGIILMFSAIRGQTYCDTSILSLEAS
jgi:hypothetical protein